MTSITNSLTARPSSVRAVPLKVPRLCIDRSASRPGTTPCFSAMALPGCSARTVRAVARHARERGARGWIAAFGFGGAELTGWTICARKADARQGTSWRGLQMPVHTAGQIGLAFTPRVGARPAAPVGKLTPHPTGGLQSPSSTLQYWPAPHSELAEHTIVPSGKVSVSLAAAASTGAGCQTCANAATAGPRRPSSVHPEHLDRPLGISSPHHHQLGRLSGRKGHVEVVREE